MTLYRQVSTCVGCAAPVLNLWTDTWRRWSFRDAGEPRGPHKADFSLVHLRLDKTATVEWVILLYLSLGLAAALKRSGASPINA